MRSGIPARNVVSSQFHQDVFLWILLVSSVSELLTLCEFTVLSFLGFPLNFVASNLAALCISYEVGLRSSFQADKYSMREGCRLYKAPVVR